MGDRVTFSVTDATRPRVSGEYDLVTIFEALHDNVTPGRRTPGAARGMLSEGDLLLVVDEAVTRHVDHDAVDRPARESERRPVVGPDR